MIVLYKLPTKNLSRQSADEYLANNQKLLNSEFYSSFGNIEIKNIVICNDSDKLEVQVLYPEIKIIKKELKNFMTETQKRKIKIFELLNTL